MKVGNVLIVVTIRCFQSESYQTGSTFSEYYHENNFVKISTLGEIVLWAVSIACLNPQCKKLTLTVSLSPAEKNANR